MNDSALQLPENHDDAIAYIIRRYPRILRCLRILLDTENELDNDVFAQAILTWKGVRYFNWEGYHQQFDGDTYINMRGILEHIWMHRHGDELKAARDE